jgi:hypothetical protein
MKKMARHVHRNSATDNTTIVHVSLLGFLHRVAAGAAVRHPDRMNADGDAPPHP